MRRFTWLLAFFASAALAQSAPMTPLRIAVVQKASPPSATPGDCVNGVSPAVFAISEGVVYSCVNDGASDYYAAVAYPDPYSSLIYWDGVSDFAIPNGLGVPYGPTSFTIWSDSGTPRAMRISQSLAGVTTFDQYTGTGGKFEFSSSAGAAGSPLVKVNGVFQATSTISASNLSGTNTGDQTSVSGNAGTATALAADPADCAANTYAYSIAASGNLTCSVLSDADVPNTITVDLAAAATALAANGANCSAGSAPIGVDASGAAESCTAYQADDADLTSIAALTTTAHGRGLLDDADAAASRATIGALYSIPILGGQANMSNGQTIYFGNKWVSPTTTAGNRKVYIRKAGVIRIAEVESNAASTAGSNEAWSVYVRLNDTTDYLVETVSLSTNERVFVNKTINITVADGDFFEIKVVNPTWATSPLLVSWAGYLLVE